MSTHQTIQYDQEQAEELRALESSEIDIVSGGSLLGAAVGAAVGALLGGPVGAAAGAVVGDALTSSSSSSSSSSGTGLCYEVPKIRCLK
jgi:hypothetical protein